MFASGLGFAPPGVGGMEGNLTPAIWDGTPRKYRHFLHRIILYAILMLAKLFIIFSGSLVAEACLGDMVSCQPFFQKYEPGPLH